MKLKVAVYAISKNEEKFAKRWMLSMSEADAVYVADTGSSDNTVEILKELGAVVNKIEVTPWRFDIARNISLSFVPDDVDICVCTDLDEVFDPGWRSRLESAWTAGKTTRARYEYIWSFNADGSPAVTFLAEKIHARRGFVWEHPVHEVLKYSGSLPDCYTEAGGVLLRHYPDSTKSRAQYLPLLELSVFENPEDDRNMHYLGREYMYYSRWDDCISTLKKHLSLKSATWKDERCASMRYIARAYRAKGDYQSAKAWLLRAIAEAPYLREPFAEAAMLANELGEWQWGYVCVCRALDITQKQKSYITEGFCYDSTLYDIGSICAFNLGLYQKALELCKTALELEPNSERLKNNFEIMKSKL